MTQERSACHGVQRRGLLGSAWFLVGREDELWAELDGFEDPPRPHLKPSSSTALISAPKSVAKIASHNHRSSTTTPAKGP